MGGDSGAELLGKGQTALRNVGDDDGRGTGGGGALEADETDGSGTTDQDGVSQRYIGSVKAGESDAQRLEEGTVLVRHVANLVAPDSRVVDVSAQHAGDGRGGEELDVVAAIVSASQAGLADTAGDVGLDSDTIANLEVLDGGVNGDNITSRFVAQDVVALDNHGTDTTSVPEVNIGAVGLG